MSEKVRGVSGSDRGIRRFLISKKLNPPSSVTPVLSSSEQAKVTDEDERQQDHRIAGKS